MAVPFVAVLRQYLGDFAATYNFSRRLKTGICLARCVPMALIMEESTKSMLGGQWPKRWSERRRRIRSAAASNNTPRAGSAWPTAFAKICASKLAEHQSRAASRPRATSRWAAP